MTVVIYIKMAEFFIQYYWELSILKIIVLNKVIFATAELFKYWVHTNSFYESLKTQFSILISTEFLGTSCKFKTIVIV